jgi:hypothetical protein
LIALASTKISRPLRSGRTLFAITSSKKKEFLPRVSPPEGLEKPLLSPITRPPQIAEKTAAP